MLLSGSYTLHINRNGPFTFLTGLNCHFCHKRTVKVRFDHKHGPILLRLLLLNWASICKHLLLFNALRASVCTHTHTLTHTNSRMCECS